MLRIYQVSIEMLKLVGPVAKRVEVVDRNHGRQLRSSALSVSLNIAEGSGNRKGNRRLRYETALGSAFETLANLEAAEAIGYIGPLDPGVRERLQHIIGTLTKLVR